MTEDTSARRAARRRRWSSVTAATIVAAAATVWILSGQFGSANAPTEPDLNAATGASVEAKPRELVAVRVRLQSAEQRESQIVIRGRTAASRSVEVRAETSGRVAEIVAERGARLSRGDVILRLAMDDRPAWLKEAKAQIVQRDVEYNAARKLNKKGFSPETRLAETRANLDAAKAALARIELDMEHTVIRAPFDGTLEARPVELGDFVDVGDRVAMVVDLDPAIVVGNVTEREIGRLRVGGQGRAMLVTGHKVDGRIRYLSTKSDERTRTFRVELEVPNPDGAVIDGVTAEIRLAVGSVRAHKVSPAVLTLADDGSVGLKIVNDEDVVEFHDAQIIEDTADGVWLAGLPNTIRIITVGQEFVRAGQKVLTRQEVQEAGS